MSKTRFPNGLTVCSTTANEYNSAAGDGDVDCNNLYTNGGVIGDITRIAVPFGVASTAQVYAIPAPFAGQIVGAFVTVGSVSAISAGYTVQVGSAGSIAVATVSNTVTTSYANEPLTTTTTSFTTANGIKVTRGVQGTTGDSVLTLLLKRTS